MAINISPSFEIKNTLGRGKAYLNKKEIVKGIMAVCEGIKLFINSKIYGKDKIEIEYQLAELVQIIRTIPEIAEYLPVDFGYTKGSERILLQALVSTIKRIINEIQEGKKEKSSDNLKTEEKRKRLLDLLQEYLMKKNYMDAAGVIKKIISEFGERPSVFVDMAKRFYNAKDYDKTIQFCKDALKKDPKNMDAYRLLINSYRYLKNYPAAEGCYKNTLKIFGEHGNIYYNLAKLYREWEKIDKARASIKKALELEPENSEYKALGKELL